MAHRKYSVRICRAQRPTRPAFKIRLCASIPVQPLPVRHAQIKQHTCGLRVMDYLEWAFRAPAGSYDSRSLSRPTLRGEIVTDPILRTPLRFARGELVFGYRLVRKLGEGSFGSVWLAANEKGFEWALKLVSLQGNGGLKEFKALQLIKDRKINNTNLLKLIDYGLLDHEGNSLASSASPLSAEAATPPAASPITDKLEDAKPVLKSAGTLMPEIKPASNQTAVEQLAARETQGAASDTKAEKHRAAWLVIVMEVGQLTLHQLQLQQTERELTNKPNRHTRAVTRMGVTAGGSKTIRDNPAAQNDLVEEPLVPLPVSVVLPYLEQAARGLDYLHRHEIVHRDIKPQNIILVGDDAKVCDYGLASESTNSTATTIGCTPAYAAPEAINNRPVPASDQYSLAVTYVELITGRWPFFGVTQTAIYREKDEGRHNLSFIRKAQVRAVLKRALAKNPQDRFATCTEFAQRLTAAENSAASHFSARLLLAAAVALLLVAVGAVGWMYPELWRGKAALPIAANRNPQELPLEIPANEPDPAALSPTNNSPQVTPENPTAPTVKPPELTPSPSTKSADEQLTSAFAEPNLPPREVLRIFETVVDNSADPTEWYQQLRDRTIENIAWHAAVEQWLQRNLNRTPQPASVDTSEYRFFDQEFRAAALQRLFNRPQTTAAELEAALASPSLRLNDSHPLAVLLRVELETRLAGSAATKAQIADWAGRVQSAQIPSLPGKLAQQRTQFLIYLDISKLSAQSMEVDWRAASERLQELLNAAPQPAWLTADRKQLLAEPLGIMALHELGQTDRDLPRFHSFKFSENRRLSNLLTTASLHQLQSNSLAGAQALVQANQALENPGSKQDWKAIEELANQAFHDPPTNEFLAAEERRMLLYYVSKLAALKNAAARSRELSDSVKGFATLLALKQGDSPLYFDFSQDVQPTDAGLYRTLIEPVVNHPAIVNNAPTAQFDPAHLALLFGARARLLQRSPAVVDLVAASNSANKITSRELQTLLLVHGAFELAREYDKLAVAAGKPAADYLIAAHNKTLATAPKRATEATHKPSDLSVLVNELDPNGAAQDAELLRLGGYVHRQQAYQERNASRRLQLASEANRRYTQALAAQQPDPQFSAQAANELAELQLTLASWTEIGRADYDRSAEQSVPPPPATKSFYLWRATNLAKQALAAQPAYVDALLTLATAQEQMAFALGVTSQYDQALETLDQGLRAADLKELAKNQLQAARGRCLLRHGQEMFSALSPEERTGKLHAAIKELETALGQRRTMKSWEPQDAETLFFLAEAHIALAVDSERGARLAQAETALRSAIEAGDARSPRLSHYRWRLLQVLSNQGGESSRPAQKVADEIFLAIEPHPADQDPVAIFGIATATGWLFPEPSKLLRWLPAKGPWHAQWRSSDAWKLEAARLYSEAALSSTLPELRRSAQQLALELPARSQPRRLADAYLQDSLARQLCYEFERLKPPGAGNASGTPGNASSNVNENQQRSYETERQTKAGIATSAIADCVQKHWDCQDERVQALLAEIGRASLADLQAGKILPNASVLEKRALWKYVTSAPSLEARDKYLEVCKQHTSLTSGSDNLNRPQLAQTSRDLLKPVFYFANLSERDPRIDAFIKKHKPAETEKKK